MKKLLFILLFIPLFSYAQTEWEYVGNDSDNSEYYVKDYKKRNYTDYIETWLKIVRTDKIVKTKKGTIKKSGIVSLEKYKFKCEEKTMALESYADYRNGILIKSGNGFGVENDIVPDSIGESLLDYLCSKF
ncbi:surface-adhesin E family protein [Chryseobacterium mucoviscidosis]|uniref:surface-adhesin E family protein n=1 Tax=Chryseobacterium mucoviscidosis TaxID=1945581 RepID=UPI0031E0FA58